MDAETETLRTEAPGARCEHGFQLQQHFWKPGRSQYLRPSCCWSRPHAWERRLWAPVRGSSSVRAAAPPQTVRTDRSLCRETRKGEEEQAGHQTRTRAVTRDASPAGFLRPLETVRVWTHGEGDNHKAQGGRFHLLFNFQKFEKDRMAGYLHGWTTKKVGG